MSIIDELLAAKRELAKIGPPLLAVKCNPADLVTIRRVSDEQAAADRAQFGYTLFQPEVFVDVHQPRGIIAAAYTRSIVDEWRRDEWRRYLLRKLRQRLAALREETAA